MIVGEDGEASYVSRIVCMLSLRVVQVQKRAVVADFK